DLPLVKQLSTGTESVRPTEQPAQPPDESADLPPRPPSGPAHLAHQSGTDSKLTTERLTQPPDESADLPPRSPGGPADQRGVNSKITSITSWASKGRGASFSSSHQSSKQTHSWSPTPNSTSVRSMKSKHDGVFQAAAAQRAKQSPKESWRQNGVFSSPTNAMSSSFEIFFGCVIGTNALLSGVEVQYRSTHLGEGLPASFVIVRHVYTVLFLAELTARVCRHGLSDFFLRGDVFWAWTDTLVVVIGLLELGVDTVALTTDQSKELPGAAVLRNVRLARLVRLTRAFRLHRIIRFISALRTLVYSIVATLKSLLWAMILILMIIYVFGLAFTGEALDFIEETGNLVQHDEDALLGEWGSLDVSMYTLFQSISGGVSWRDPAAPLQRISMLPTCLFTVYITFVYFAVLNVVTGVFCSSAVETTQRNPDLIAKSIIDNRRAATEKLQQLFGAIDDDGSGLITIDELELIAADDLMKAYFQALQIDFRDAYTLFKLIDASNDGAIKLDDFLRGCEKLKGNATSMEMAEISYDLRNMTNQMATMLVALETPSIEKLRRVRGSMTKDLGSL
ncbi:unnamed protein product, partial [Prorocentrum cordatum]